MPICKYISILFFTIGYKYMTKYKDYITAESIFNKAITAIKNLDNKKDDEQQIQSTSLYNIACIYSLNNDIDTSLKYLDYAIDIGYPNISSLNTDNDLMNVRKSDKFNELMIKYNII
jgi:tetratricopeptide (TPR) repeat protein